VYVNEPVYEDFHPLKVFDQCDGREREEEVDIWSYYT
jgi:hypothetical protein